MHTRRWWKVNWQELLQGLADDRKRRDEEIEGERVRREAKIVEERLPRVEEIVEERRNREVENIARESAMSKWLEEVAVRRERQAMRNQMEQMVKIVERSVITATAPFRSAVEPDSAAIDLGRSCVRHYTFEGH